jgi:hypothetical protein
VARQRKSESDMNLSPLNVEMTKMANKLVWHEKLMDSGYLAMTFNYHQTGRNCINDLHILCGHLWRGRFQISVIAERQVTGGNGRSLMGQEV